MTTPSTPPQPGAPIPMHSPCRSRSGVDRVQEARPAPSSSGSAGPRRGLRPGPWAIVMRATGRRYIGRGYATEAQATAVLADLLRPYPADHAWRRALVVRRTGAMEAP